MENTHNMTTGILRIRQKLSAFVYQMKMTYRLKREIPLLFLLTFITLGSTYAQNIVSGVVRDEISGEPLPGATVIVKGKAAGTMTDFTGGYKLQVPEGAEILTFSFIGYKPKEVAINGQSVIDVSLMETLQEMEEIVVVGYAEQKKESVIGSISQLKGDELVMSRGDLSVTNALTGVVPGITTIQMSGQPGETASNIFIRGKSSWVDNSPLFLVDGIERDYEDIDPNEIASISVLKDASATAVFGTKGANGVILITTKEGKEGKAKIKFSHNTSFKQPISNFYMADRATVMELKNQALFNDRVFDPAMYYSDEDINKYRNKVDPYLYPEVNWYDELTKEYAVSQNYNLNISGGSKRVNYFASLSYANEGDIFDTTPSEAFDPSFNYKRYNYRTNLNLKLTSTTNVKLGLAGNIAFKNQPGYGSGVSDSWAKSDFFKRVYYKAPSYIYPVRYADGNIGNDGQENPYLMLNYSGAIINKATTQAVDLHLDQKLDFITKGLSVTGKVAYNTKFEYYSKISNKNNRTSEFNIPSYLYTETDTIRFPNENYVVRPVTVDNEQLGAFKRELYYEGAIRYQNRFDNAHNVSAMALVMRSQNVAKVKWPAYEESWIGRVTYDYKSRYFAEFNGSYNGSEKFAPGLKFGFFPSFAAGWTASNESFIKNSEALSFIDLLKFRFSYGEVGYDKGASRWTYLQLYDNGGNVALGNPPKNSPTYNEGRFPNPLATWEVAKKANLGIELEMFERFTATLDLYNEKRSGILMERRTLPSWIGVDAPYRNMGETKTQGYELTLAWNHPVTESFTYWVKGNMAYTENRVEFRDDPTNTPNYMQDAGKPIGTDYRLITDGLYQDWDDIYNSVQSVWVTDGRIPGDMRFVDYNGDGVIDEFDRVASQNLDYPLFTYSFSLGFSYKGFELNSLFAGVGDVSKTVTDALLWEFTNADYETANPHNGQAWTPQMPHTNVPALHLDNITRANNYQPSDYAYQNASYLRLKRLEASYRFKSKKLKQLIGLSNLRVYTGATNLFTFTKMDERFDPEAATLAAYPLIKSYNVGLTATF